jgi:hypothetical protein
MYEACYLDWDSPCLQSLGQDVFVDSVESSLDIKADHGDNMFAFPGLVDVFCDQLQGIDGGALLSGSKVAFGEKTVGLIEIRDSLCKY